MSTRVYVGRLARRANKRDIEHLFKNYGDIREVNLKSGFGFVEFADERDAKDAVYDFHGKNFLGERLIVEIARGARRHDERRPRGNDRSRSHYRLVVENIAPGTNWQDLKDMMRKAGEVTFADISRDCPSEGIVEFHVREDMEYALKKLNDQDLNGQRVKLREEPIKDRGSSRRHRSRSKSRSRSPRRRRHSRSRSPPRRRRRSPSRSASPPRKRRSTRDETPDRRDSRERRRARSEPRSRSGTPPVKSETRSRSRTPIRSPARSSERSQERSPAHSPARSPERSPARSEGSAPRDD